MACHKSRFTIHQSPFTNSPFTIHKLTIHHSPFTTERFTIHHSPFTIRATERFTYSFLPKAHLMAGQAFDNR